MKKLINIFIYVFLPFTSIFVFFLFLNILVLDWNYAHKTQATYQDSFDWLSYKAKINILKTINNFNNQEKGLPSENLFISSKVQKKLLEDPPYSTKIWQRAFFITKDDEVRNIQIRHRGDNSENWMFEKKHWRIKSRKEEQFDRYRYFNYIPFDLNYYFSGLVANNIGLVSPKFDLIELFINQKSSGIYVKAERINENFLRRNRIMPVNIYKGEQILSEAVVAADNDLFGNSGVWSKVATFNQTEREDKSDLINFLNILIKSENNFEDKKKLFEKLDLDQWVKFSAYQILTQNYHNDSYHNMRLIIDPWSGKISQIVFDPIIGRSIYTNQLLNFEKSSHNLLRILNKNSFFIDSKYKELLSILIDKKIIDKQVNFLKSLEDKIILSGSRDNHRLSHNFSNINWKKSFINKRINNYTEKNNIDLLVKNILQHKSNILSFLYSKPNASWFHNENGFNINIDGHLPISNLVVSFTETIPNSISIDINKNKIIDKNEVFHPSKDGNFNIPLSLYANRTSYAKNTYGLASPDIFVSKTRFNFITEGSLKPNKISYENPFSKKKYKLNYLNEGAVKPNNGNYAILKNFSIDTNVKTFSGLININKNLIVDKNTIIEPGTTFLIEKDKSIIFKNKVTANGTLKDPIIFKKKSKDSWGTIALQGKNTENSEFKNIIISGGSGAIINNIFYTSAFSLHDTKNITMTDIEINNNTKYDDAFHIVYCENVVLDNIFIDKAFSDALDIDMSKNIKISNSLFFNPKNDSVDTMESSVIIDSSEMIKSGDKGVSIGENSNVLIYNSYLNENKIGIAIKDRSNAKIYYSDFIENEVHISSYQKNYQYGNGGYAKISRSNFKDNNIYLNSDNKSTITIDDSSFNGSLKIKDDQIILTQNNSFDGNKNVFNLYDEFINEINHEGLNKIKNVNLRGSDFLNN